MDKKPFSIANYLADKGGLTPEETIRYIAAEMLIAPNHLVKDMAKWFVKECTKERGLLATHEDMMEGITIRRKEMNTDL